MDQATIRDAARLWIIVLAAGSSSRLGFPKQLLRLRGRSLLTRTVELAHGIAADRIVVVIGAAAQRMRSHLRRNDTNVRIVLNNRWRDGLGTSLATGIAALPGNARHALVLLCDQPDVSAASLQRLLTRWRRGRATVVASRYAGRIGVPAIFPRSAFGALRALDADTGAREFLNNPEQLDSGQRDGEQRDSRHRIAITAVPMPEAQRDIDTPADAAAFGR